MRERLKRYLDDFWKALNNLENGVEQATDELDIDGTIKRFELCYELSWKLIREYLSDKGIICNNPRDSFKNGFSNGLIDREDVWLKMIEDRNDLVHKYDFKVSRSIFEHIRDSYLSSFNYLYQKIKQEEQEEV